MVREVLPTAAHDLRCHVGNGCYHYTRNLFNQKMARLRRYIEILFTIAKQIERKKASKRFGSQVKLEPCVDGRLLENQFSEIKWKSDGKFQRRTRDHRMVSFIWF